MDLSKIAQHVIDQEVYQSTLVGSKAMREAEEGQVIDSGIDRKSFTKRKSKGFIMELKNKKKGVIENQEKLNHIKSGVLGHKYSVKGLGAGGSLSTTHSTGAFSGAVKSKSIITHGIYSACKTRSLNSNQTPNQKTSVSQTKFKTEAESGSLGEKDTS